MLRRGLYVAFESKEVILLLRMVDSSPDLQMISYSSCLFNYFFQLFFNLYEHIFFINPCIFKCVPKGIVFFSLCLFHAWSGFHG